ncbi:hypothetical protein Pcinc_000229 [Petrolisthes cinctipes]|uniref:DDE-1 domain-containing protein n=1 Tax=Petrolisthes cinctipes TaxID=88211 RepID=A0AAE1GN89_PETCI|nr:hypothetical protein Pcinc_000229 [Petrolisthes cinctipes]
MGDPVLNSQRSTFHIQHLYKTHQARTHVACLHDSYHGFYIHLQTTNIFTTKLQDTTKQVVFLPPWTTSLIHPLDQELIATLKKFYHQQVYSYLRSSTETQVELATLEDIVMSNSETEDNPDTPLLPPSKQDKDNNNTTPPPAKMSVMIFWH